MFTRLILIGALLALSIAYFFPSGSPSSYEPYIQGKNKTVLIVSNSEHGLANVHLATSSALLENYPDIDVHYASFASIRKRVERVSFYAKSKTPAARDIIFHEMKGVTFGEAIMEAGRDFILPPASKGISSFADDFQLWISPWSVDDHMDIFNALNGIIDDVDPAVVVLDTWFRPAIDATRIKNRQHAFVTPNILMDNFLGLQPLATRFWKFPAIASGFAFPVPLRDVLENMYLNMWFIYGAMMTPALSVKQAALSERGLKEPMNFFGIHRHDTPWITQTTEGATVPLDYVPPNVTCAGPIVLSGATAAEQDPELAVWLKKAGTVLVNLGSNVAYDEQRATVMSMAIAEVLEKTALQILWKFNKIGDYSDEALSPLQKYLANDRLRMPGWLTADPTSLLETGDIVASIHHGGSNCYHEAIATSVPQVTLPMWADLYNYAALVENIGVGVWGCRKESPNWTNSCLTTSFLYALDGGRHSASLREKAREIGRVVQARDKGRDIAAREIAKLAYVH